MALFRLCEWVMTSLARSKEVRADWLALLAYLMGAAHWPKNEAHFPSSNHQGKIEVQFAESSHEEQRDEKKMKGPFADVKVGDLGPVPHFSG